MLDFGHDAPLTPFKGIGKAFSISLRRLVKYLKVIVHSYKHFLVSLQGLVHVHEAL